MKIAVHLKAEVFEWTESEAFRYHEFLVATKKETQKKLKELLESVGISLMVLAKEERQQHNRQYCTEDPSSWWKRHRHPDAT